VWERKEAPHAHSPRRAQATRPSWSSPSRAYCYLFHFLIMFYDIMILLHLPTSMIELFMLDLFMFMIYLFQNLIMQLSNYSTAPMSNCTFAGGTFKIANLEDMCSLLHWYMMRTSLHRIHTHWSPNCLQVRIHFLLGFLKHFAPNTTPWTHMDSVSGDLYMVGKL
jgi:hypothetical protein